MNTNEFDKMNDRELIAYIKGSRRHDEPWSNYDKAITTLWNRYQRQIHRNWHKLSCTLGNTDYVTSRKDDFYGEAHEAFMTALDKIDLSRIENDDWKFVGYLNFYLTNLRTKFHKDIKRDSNNKTIDMMVSSNEEGNAEIDPDVENAYWESEGYSYEPSYVVEMLEEEDNCNRAIRECMNKWNDFQREIFRRLYKGEKRQSIAKALNVQAIKVYNECTKMKNDMKKCLGI